MLRIVQWLVVVGLLTFQSVVAQVTYRSDVGNFTCEFPVKPTEETSELEGGGTFYQLQAIKGEEIYMLFFSNYTEKITDKAKAREATVAAKDAFIEKLGAEKVSEKTYTYNGFDGYEVVLKTADGFKVHYRVIHIHKTLYQFAVVGANPSASSVSKFFTSFKYTGK